ncbi:MAG: NAD-dependent epimerase/dehydratase family protein [Desulfobacteraceae bacterium]|nr:NAD-dependent epimerase/dehydratase family protein [Pseudomonadota bacterium]MBU4462723.1 NAD-dependent epimerase/dehydratase family protein [Pseudomonadota bacterium]MCG2754995.1 NAD-dependent epimerase/dehydratase family protein [Desulfobacteraceae bacterium]
MKVLVTGANGFIGQALCKRMLTDEEQRAEREEQGANSREHGADTRR